MYISVLPFDSHDFIVVISHDNDGVCNVRARAHAVLGDTSICCN